MQPGTIIADKFRVERVIGKGGMGTVVVATHLQLEQRVAIKFLNPELANQPAIAERFLREARSSAKLKSDYVCRVIDVAQLADGSPYIVMECLEGEDLGRVVARTPLPIATAADFVAQACVAIAEAHAAGIVHRDLKPSNLFLTQRLDGAALIKVLDFGIATAPAGSEARLTQTTSLMGSPGYMSPEQLRSAKEADARSDVWSLGVILYELVSGRLPFPGSSITEVAVKIAVDDAVPLASGNPAFDAMVLGAIEKDIARRYQSVAELATALAPFGGGQAAALAPMIGKLLGGSTSAIGASSRAPVADARAFGATVQSEGLAPVMQPTQATTLGAAASASMETAAAAPRSRTGLVVGLVGLVAIAGGTGIYLATRGDHPAAPVIAVVADAALAPVTEDAAAVAIVAPLPDAPAKPPPADAPAKPPPRSPPADAASPPTDAPTKSPPADAAPPSKLDPVAATKIAFVSALGAHDCAKARDIAAAAHDPAMVAQAAKCTDEVPDAKDPVTNKEVQAVNAQARALLATDPAAAIKAAKRVLALHSGNGLSWAIVTVGYCKLGQPGKAERAYASFARTQQREVRIDVAAECKASGVALPVTAPGSSSP